MSKKLNQLTDHRLKSSLDNNKTDLFHRPYPIGSDGLNEAIEIKKTKTKLVKMFEIGDIIKTDYTKLVLPQGKIFISKYAKVIGKDLTNFKLKIRFLNPYKNVKSLGKVSLDINELERVISKLELGEIKTDAAILGYIKLNNLDPEEEMFTASGIGTSSVGTTGGAGGI